MSSKDRIDKWGRDQAWPIILVILAREITFNAKIVHELFKEIWPPKKQHSLPDLGAYSESLKFYKNKSLWMDPFISFFLPENDIEIIKAHYQVSGATAVVRQFVAEINEWGMQPVEQKKQDLQDVLEDRDMIESLCSDLKEVYEAQFTRMVDDSGNIGIKKTRILQSPPIIFFLRVIFPCFILYGESPVFLLRKARQGNMKALENLLSLDDSVLHDPKIAAILHKAKQEGNKARLQRITKAMISYPKCPTRSKVKKRTASLTQMIFRMLKVDITTPQIRELFDAFEVAMTEGKHLGDEDLPDGLEAWSKAIQRENKQWPIYKNMPPDKKSA